MWAYNRRPAKSTLFIVPLKRKRELKSTEPGSEFQSFNNNNKAWEKEKAHSLAKNDERFNRCMTFIYYLYLFPRVHVHRLLSTNYQAAGELCQNRNYANKNKRGKRIKQGSHRPQTPTTGCVTTWEVTLSARKVVLCVRWPATGIRAYSKEFFGVHNFKSSCMM